MKKAIAFLLTLAALTLALTACEGKTTTTTPAVTEAPAQPTNTPEATDAPEATEAATAAPAN